MTSAFDSMLVPGIIRKPRLSWALITVAVGSLLACSDSDSPAEPPLPAPNVRLIVESASEAILQQGDAYNVIVSAEDTLGSPIPLGDLDLVWRSSDEDVATVNEDGRVMAVGGGLVQIEVAVGGDTAEIQLAVNDIVPEIYDDPPYPVFFAMYEDRVLGYSAWNTGGKRIYEFESGSWSELTNLSTSAIAGFVRRFVALPSGEFAAAATVVTGSDSTATVWSSRSGSWNVDFTEASDDPIDRGPFLFQSGSDAVAFHANRFDPLPGSRFGVSFTPLIWLRDSAGTWRNLEHPAKQGEDYLQVSEGFVLGGQEVYVCGSLGPSPGEPPQSPIVSHWDGTVWSIIDLSGYSSADYGLVCRGHVVSGRAYGAMMGSDTVLGVFTLRDGAVTVDTELPDVVAQGVFSDARTLPSGRWLFTRLTRLSITKGGLLAPTFVWQEEDGSWRRYWLDPDLSITSFPYVDPETGQIWFVDNSPDGTDLATFVLTP
jgi:hypothetical protein